MFLQLRVADAFRSSSRWCRWSLWTAKKWPSLWVSPYRTCLETLRLMFGRLQSCCSIHSILTRLQCPPPSWTAAASPIARRRHDDAPCAYNIEPGIDFDAHTDAYSNGKLESAQSAPRQAQAHRDVV